MGTGGMFKVIYISEIRVFAYIIGVFSVIFVVRSFLLLRIYQHHKGISQTRSIKKLYAGKQN